MTIPKEVSVPSSRVFRECSSRIIRRGSFRKLLIPTIENQIDRVVLDVFRVVSFRAVRLHPFKRHGLVKQV